MTNLGIALEAYQYQHHIRNDEMAKEIGIPASTLSRIKKGKMPDAVGMVKVWTWLVEKKTLPTGKIKR